MTAMWLQRRRWEKLRDCGLWGKAWSGGGVRSPLAGKGGHEGLPDGGVAVAALQRPLVLIGLRAGREASSAVSARG